MKNKKLAVIGVAAGISILSAMSVFAVGWQRDNVGWWYQNDDTSYPVSTWKWIDGNNDGIAECYYFDSNGYILSNTTTPDHYEVNADGEWVVNGVVQTKAAVAETSPAYVEEETVPEETIADNNNSSDSDWEKTHDTKYTGEREGYEYIPGFGYIKDEHGQAVAIATAPETAGHSFLDD